MIVLYIDSTPLVVGGAAADGAAWVTTTEGGELGPATIVPEKVGGKEECDRMAVDVLVLFRIA